MKYLFLFECLSLWMSSAFVPCIGVLLSIRGWWWGWSWASAVDDGDDFDVEDEDLDKFEDEDEAVVVVVIVCFQVHHGHPLTQGN